MLMLAAGTSRTIPSLFYVFFNIAQFGEIIYRSFPQFIIYVVDISRQIDHPFPTLYDLAHDVKWEPYNLHDDLLYHMFPGLDLPYKANPAQPLTRQVGN